MLCHDFPKMGGNFRSKDKLQMTKGRENICVKRIHEAILLILIQIILPGLLVCGHGVAF
jgi:hypothetical protein